MIRNEFIKNQIIFSPENKIKTTQQEIWIKMKFS